MEEEVEEEVEVEVEEVEEVWVKRERAPVLVWVSPSRSSYVASAKTDVKEGEEEEGEEGEERRREG